MIRSAVVLMSLMATASGFSPNHISKSSATSTQQNAVEEVASAIQQSSDMFHHGVVGPFSDILQGHHAAQFDNDGGIMMTEHLDDPVLKPGKGSFVPPSPMKDAETAAKAASLVVPTAAILQEKSHGRPVPVYYMD